MVKSICQPCSQLYTGIENRVGHFKAFKRQNGKSYKKPPRKWHTVRPFNAKVEPKTYADL